jgi:hypothetical protein
VKSKKRIISQITYSGDELGLQVKGELVSPFTVKVTSQIESTLKMIETIESGIVKDIHEHSKEFFNGKSFTREKIANSIVSPWENSNEGLVIHCQDSDYTCCDYFNGDIPSTSLEGQVVDFVLILDSVEYKKSLFKVHCKIFYIRQPRPKARLEGFFEAPTPPNSPNSPNSPQTPQTPQAPETPNSPQTPNSPETPANSDHLDFFE